MELRREVRWRDLRAPANRLPGGRGSVSGAPGLAGAGFLNETAAAAQARELDGNVGGTVWIVTNFFGFG